ncbi:uncharacterized protein LOC135205933 isoform X2 [Macrobrachium nipponense]|uniref:uncharacterized protein LOC135205933 isoform X2 n=1 Tax=Macrobrachium nipponense TaxID=159736 RepID=UPI0030C8ACE1
MVLKVVILMAVAVASSLGQDNMVQESEPASVITPETLRPSILRELPKPFAPGEFPYYYHPHRYHPYYHYPYHHYQHYRNHPSREDGKGVAVHPGGATSYIFPQVHGIGKRSAEASAEPSYAYSYMSHLHPYFNRPFGYYRRYPYYGRPFGLYHHHLDKRSTPVRTPGEPQYSFVYPSDPTDPFGSYHGYSYRW